MDFPVELSVMVTVSAVVFDFLVLIMQPFWLESLLVSEFVFRLTCFQQPDWGCKTHLSLPVVLG